MASTAVALSTSPASCAANTAFPIRLVETPHPAHTPRSRFHTCSRMYLLLLRIKYSCTHAAPQNVRRGGCTFALHQRHWPSGASRSYCSRRPLSPCVVVVVLALCRLVRWCFLVRPGMSHGLLWLFLASIKISELPSASDRFIG